MASRLSRAESCAAEESMGPSKERTKSIRLVLADDHTIVRHSLTRALQHEGDMVVVGQAEDGRATVELARTLCPDIVVMDISMPDLNGIEATREIRQELPSVKVIALSMYSAEPYVTGMFQAGASGYLLKDCSLDELTQAIRTVAGGKTYVCPSLRNVMEDLTRTGSETKPTAFSSLTKRERQVLQLLAEGCTTKEIAQRLHLSAKTVETHRIRVKKKLNIDNLAQLTKYAIREGLTSPES
jgi:DNA-binding NarL/FixJ family response regulator